ncbi:39S ribosomal protein L12, mitochondrial [Apis mellifera caucasica]|uniref:39S ribosomal protein L12, mitochondrial n=1 Tax=Apis mellifera TaxID=7460 RepID=A0A7M7R796_APIME|nr:39S ribosomal protein L12, mitochondrial [Apis mellifera]KAG6797570.1 39S ribosomal protein L12, mitochondrial [Apis mellifera caucasica]KAG9437418.1 39S ribosomal protein L12, mitochondrial [Apis mellifera carnica]|eukprot:XP_393417.3 39S ribosomal protein L12, mitochondrial [Apis mellifera]
MYIMNTLRFICQRNIHQVRHFHKCIIQQTEAVAAMSTPPLSESVATENELPVNSKIEQIANQIVCLNLIEVAQLSELLKKKLNLPDAMPMSNFVAAPVKGEEEVEEAAAVQTAFSVKLKSFNEKQKIALIKELKNILPNCNLVQAKKFVESAPNIIKSDLSKHDADELADLITKVGGIVEIV